MSALSLVHYAPVDPQDWFSDLRGERVPDAPPVTEAMEVALRREVLGRGDVVSTAWHHCDGRAWDAVVQQHKAGRHDDASDLARLLRWCDQRHTGREVGMWEIVGGESR